MKSTLITLLVILGLCVIAVVTCPDRQAHKDAMMEKVSPSHSVFSGTCSPSEKKISREFSPKKGLNKEAEIFVRCFGTS